MFQIFLLLGWHIDAFVLRVGLAHLLMHSSCALLIFLAGKYGATMQDNHRRLPIHNTQQTTIQQYNIGVHNHKHSHPVPDLPFVGLAQLYSSCTLLICFAEKYGATIQDNRPRLPIHNKQQYNIHGNKQPHHVPDLPFVGPAH
jgi:hypothetical protein